MGGVVLFRMKMEYFVPDFDPFRIVEFGVIDSSLVSEYRQQPANHLCRQSNFWKEVEYLLPLVQTFFDQLNVYFRLAAGGDTM